VAVVAVMAACGGGGTTDKDAGKGQRITDPAKVPSSTPIQDPLTYKIQDNAVISPPGGAAGVPIGSQTPTGAKPYTVKANDTCGAIAAQFGITVADLLKANRTIDPNCGNLHEGDQLKIPAPPATATTGGTTSGPTPKPSGKEYTVKSGDTCDAIAKGYGVDVNKLIQLNGLDADCRNLQPGQVVKIP